MMPLREFGTPYPESPKIYTYSMPNTNKFNAFKTLILLLFNY